MAWKDIVGARFSPAEFDDYVRQLVFTDWRPQFVVVHNTGSPSLADRPAGFTPAHMQNFVHYYRDTQGWSAGPHCFVDQNGIWVFTPLTTTGVHSPSWNSMSWGVETLGDYSTEAFTDPIHEHLVACLATLHAVIPLDVNNLHFHKEDPLTTHLCPGVNIIKPVLIHDVQTLISSRQTLADPARGRYTGASPAEVAPESHFFADHGSLTQTDAIAYGPVTDDKENKYRVTGLVKATADVNAYAAVSGIVMIQRVADENNPGTYLPNVVNLVLKPYKQPIKGFTRVKYFIYRNLRLDAFLKGTSAADEALVRNKTSGSSFIQNLWTIHTAQNGTAPFQSTVLGFDPANQLGTAGIDKLFHRQNANEQLPFAARGDQIGTFYTNSGADAFGIEILLEGDFEPDYDYVRTSTETVIDVSGAAAGTDSQLQRARILNYLDPAAFYGMHMAPAGWLEVQSGSAKKKLKGVAVYNDVVQQFATHNTLYIDVRNENGLALDFYGAYDDPPGNAIEVGDTASSLAAQEYTTDKWPLIIRKSVAEANSNDYSLVFLRLRRAYNHKPILYLLHGETDRKATKGRFIADTDLIAATATKTNDIAFRYPTKDLGGGQRIGVAWLIRADYTLRQDPANLPFPAKVVPTATYFDNLFGPVDVGLPWTVSHSVIAWATGQDKKYVDGDGVAALGFEHVADRGVAFSQWTGAASTAGTVLFYATAKDSFVNKTKEFVPQNGIASGVSNRGSYFAEAMLFDGYGVDSGKLEDGTNEVKTQVLRETQPYSRPAEAMLLLGLTRSEVDTNLKPLTGLDPRYPRNVLLEEVAGSPFTDVHGTAYYKYRLGLRGIKNDGNVHQIFPATDVFIYTTDRKFFFSSAFTQATPAPPTPERNLEETRGATIRKGDEYVIASASGTTVTISEKPKAQSQEPKVDFTREIVPADMVTIGNAGYAVVSVSISGENGVITLDHSPGALTPGTDILYCPTKPREEYFIAKDRLSTLAGVPRMEMLVDQFITSVNAVLNDGSAPAALKTLVNDYGPKILQRARLLCGNDGFAYADDRILYWARIKMSVHLKNHPYLDANFDEQNELAKLFDKKSRGYDSVTFSNAGGYKKVLISGFDPFDIDKNSDQGNPSGAVALALHGRDFPTSAPTIHVQSAIFPVRYADFGNNGAGVAETFFERFINSGHPDYKAEDQPDIIVTLSQTNTFEFLLERFAARARQQGRGDNLDPNKPPQLPRDVDGKGEFYETTLEAAKIIPAKNKSGKFKVFYNNHFEYKSGAHTYSYLERQPDSEILNLTSPALKLEDTGHPDKAAFGDVVPSGLTEITTPKKSTITSIQGSGGSFLSNEIFYRVARLREKHNNALKTGHYHLPMIQHAPETGNSARPIGLQFDLLKELIEEVVNSLVRAFS